MDYNDFNNNDNKIKKTTSIFDELKEEPAQIDQNYNSYLDNYDKEEKYFQLVKEVKRNANRKIVFSLIIILVLTAVFVPFYIDWKLEQTKNALNAEFQNKLERQRNLPKDYQSIGLVGAENMKSVVEIRSSGGSGSGFILDKNGYVLTNSHVIHNQNGVLSTQIKAKFYDSNSMFPLTIISYDKDKDLALLKLNYAPANIYPITFGNSDKLNYGEDCVAVGNPQGEGLSVSSGIISVPLRKINKDRVIQTDTAINPGNSGGPLFNIYSEVIGVVVSKYVDETLEGMGFAIPSNIAIDFLKESNQKTTHQVNYNLSTNY